MLTIRTSKFNTTIKKPSSALFLWFHNSKGWFVDLEVIQKRQCGELKPFRVHGGGLPKKASTAWPVMR
jgi:hypothetical protein